MRSLLLRARLAGTDNPLFVLIRFPRPQRMERISADRMSQSSICDVSTALVGARSANKLKRDFAARIVFNEFDSA
jgi:hypothetical protein